MLNFTLNSPNHIRYVIITLTTLFVKWHMHMIFHKNVFEIHN